MTEQSGCLVLQPVFRACDTEFAHQGSTGRDPAAEYRWFTPYGQFLMPPAMSAHALAVVRDLRQECRRSRFMAEMRPQPRATFGWSGFLIVLLVVALVIWLAASYTP